MIISEQRVGQARPGADVGHDQQAGGRVGRQQLRCLRDGLQPGVLADEPARSVRTLRTVDRSDPPSSTGSDRRQPSRSATLTNIPSCIC